MTRSELILALAQRFPQVEPKAVERAVQTIVNAMTRALVRGGRVEIRGFGSFDLNYRARRMARNPKTGAVFKVRAKWGPHFKAGKALREQVARSVATPPLKIAA